MEKYFIIGLAVLFIVTVAIFLHKIDRLKKDNASSILRIVDQLNDLSKENVKIKNAYLMQQKGVFGKDAKGETHKFVYRYGNKVVSISHGFRHKSFTKEQLDKFFSTQTKLAVFEAFDW